MTSRDYAERPALGELNVDAPTSTFVATLGERRFVDLCRHPSPKRSFLFGRKGPAPKASRASQSGSLPPVQFWVAKPKEQTHNPMEAAGRFAPSANCRAKPLEWLFGGRQLPLRWNERSGRHNVHVQAPPWTRDCACRKGVPPSFSNSPAAAQPNEVEHDTSSQAVISACRAVILSATSWSASSPR